MLLILEALYIHPLLQFVDRKLSRQDSIQSNTTSSKSSTSTVQIVKCPIINQRVPAILPVDADLLAQGQDIADRRPEGLDLLLLVEQLLGDGPDDGVRVRQDTSRQGRGGGVEATRPARQPVRQVDVEHGGQREARRQGPRRGAEHAGPLPQHERRRKLEQARRDEEGEAEVEARRRGQDRDARRLRQADVGRQLGRHDGGGGDLKGLRVWFNEFSQYSLAFTDLALITNHSREMDYWKMDNSRGRANS